MIRHDDYGEGNRNAVQGETQRTADVIIKDANVAAEIFK